MAKSIVLPDGNIATVDDEDYERIKSFRWLARDKGKLTELYYVSAVVSLHRMVLGLEHDDKTVVDHIDGNGLNNCKSNLRLVTVAQNAKNRRKIRPLTAGSKYKGVCFISRNGTLNKPWKAQIFADGKSVHLGYFATDRDGAEAYNEAAKKYFGAYAFLNVLDDKPE